MSSTWAAASAEPGSTGGRPRSSGRRWMPGALQSSKIHSCCDSPGDTRSRGVLTRKSGAPPESRRIRPRPDTILGRQAMEARCGESQNSIVGPEKPRQNAQSCAHRALARPVNPESPKFETENRLAGQDSLRTLWDRQEDQNKFWQLVAVGGR